MNDPQAVFEGDYDAFRDRVVGAFNDLIVTHEKQSLSLPWHGYICLSSIYGTRNPL